MVLNFTSHCWRHGIRTYFCIPINSWHSISATLVKVPSLCAFWIPLLVTGIFLPLLKLAFLFFRFFFCIVGLIWSAFLTDSEISQERQNLTFKTVYLQLSLCHIQFGQVSKFYIHTLEYTPLDSGRWGTADLIETYLNFIMTISNNRVKYLILFLISLRGFFTCPCYLYWPFTLTVQLQQEGFTVITIWHRDWLWLNEQWVKTWTFLCQEGRPSWPWSNTAK